MAGSRSDLITGAGAVAAAGAAFLTVGATANAGSRHSVWHNPWFDVGCALVVVALVLVLFGLLSPGPRRKRDEIARQTRQLERQQADKVAVLTVREQPQLVHVTNNSPRPIRDVTACIDLGPGKDRRLATQVELWGTTPENNNFGPDFRREHLDAPCVEFIRPAVRATFTFALPLPLSSTPASTCGSISPMTLTCNGKSARTCACNAATCDQLRLAGVGLQRLQVGPDPT